MMTLSELAVSINRLSEAVQYGNWGLAFNELGMIVNETGHFVTALISPEEYAGCEVMRSPVSRKTLDEALAKLQQAAQPHIQAKALPSGAAASPPGAAAAVSPDLIAGIIDFVTKLVGLWKSWPNK